ncbi:MAG TPA: hypothetical protein VEH27_07080 [Methylomirabilota bacterium]|nr:hypothetical protein [Methylomirabilota bacterium]
MQPLLAIVWLTLKAALRYRLVLLLTLTLVAGVVVLPLIIQDDGTAQGFTQIILTYTLSLITALLGFANLWLACGTLARDMEEAQMQMVAVKPIPRWKIWLGKWLGILALNAALLTVCGIAIYALMQFRAGKLDPKQREVLQKQVLVARGSAQEPYDEAEIQQDVDRIFREMIKNRPPDDATDLRLVRQMVEARVKSELQVVPPGYQRRWEVPFGRDRELAANQELTLRVKFNVADPREGAKYGTVWEVGAPGRSQRLDLMLPADSFQEFTVPAKLLTPDGMLPVTLSNPNEIALLVPLEDGLEVLYRKGGFGLNFARGIVIIFCWLAVLAAVGLAASTFLAFPVAAFCSIAVLTFALSSGTLEQIVEEGGIMGVNHETGLTDNPVFLDRVAVPVAKGMLFILNLAREFSPIDKLSSGRSIDWDELGRAILQMIVLTCGLLAAIGMAIFSRRELATAQTGH